MIFETLALEDVSAVAVPANAMFFVMSAAPTVCAVATTPMAASGLFRLASPEVVAVASVAALDTLTTLDVALVVATAEVDISRDLVRPASPTVTPLTDAVADCSLVLSSAPDADADTDAALASAQSAVAYAVVDALAEASPTCVLVLESAAARFAETATAAAMRLDLLTAADATADAEMAPAARLVLPRTPDATPDADTEADCGEVLLSAPEMVAVAAPLAASLNPSDTLAATVAVTA
jgi:hypothetical protein